MRAHLVVVGAHPLDAEILGGAQAAHAADRGLSSVLVHLTNGARSYPRLEPSASAAASWQEAQEAARVLGTRQEWLDLDSRSLRAVGLARDLLAVRLREWRPEVVITHWRGSWHKRHRVAHRLVRNALAAAGLSPALYYGENFEDLAGFAPSCYVDIAAVCERWWRALESYELVRASKDIAAGDDRTFPYHAYYRAAPRVRGLESGLPLAQALAVEGRRPRKPAVVATILREVA